MKIPPLALTRESAPFDKGVNLGVASAAFDKGVNLGVASAALDKG